MLKMPIIIFPFFSDICFFSIPTILGRWYEFRTKDGEKTERAATIRTIYGRRFGIRAALGVKTGRNQPLTGGTFAHNQHPLSRQAAAAPSPPASRYAVLMGGMQGGRRRAKERV